MPGFSQGSLSKKLTSMATCDEQAPCNLARSRADDFETRRTGNQGDTQNVSWSMYWSMGHTPESCVPLSSSSSSSILLNSCICMIGVGPCGVLSFLYNVRRGESFPVDSNPTSQHGLCARLSCWPLHSKEGLLVRHSTERLRWQCKVRQRKRLCERGSWSISWLACYGYPLGSMMASTHMM